MDLDEEIAYHRLPTHVDVAWRVPFRERERRRLDEVTPAERYRHLGIFRTMTLSTEARQLHDSDEPKAVEASDSHLDDVEGRATHAPPATPRWYRRAHVIGLVILAVVSIWGVREFLAGDANALAAMWSRTVSILPWVFAFAVLDVAVEATAWMMVYERFGVRARDPLGAAVAVSGKAGLLMPAQLGRLLRPDLMVRLGRSPLGHGLKAAVFLLDSASVVALLAGLVAWRFQPLFAPVAGAAVIATCLFLANRISPLLSGTALELPRRFWWSWKTFLIVVLQSAGWVAHGFAFWVLASALDGSVGVWDALFLAPSSAVLGLGSGVPGGLGATEVLLGASLGINQVPEAQLALGVGLFRVLTFWAWLPIGWLAVAAVTLAVR